MSVINLYIRNSSLILYIIWSVVLSHPKKYVSINEPSKMLLENQKNV